MNLLFPCLVLRLYDEPGVPEVLGVDEKVGAMTVAQTNIMKDLAHPVLPRIPVHPIQSL